MSDLNGSHTDSGSDGVRRTLRLLLGPNVIFFTLELNSLWTANIWERISETLACVLFVRGMRVTRQEGRGVKCAAAEDHLQELLI